MDDPEIQEGVRSGYQTHPVLRQWRLVLTATLVTLALTLVFVASRSPTYVSTARVLVLPTGLPSVGASGSDLRSSPIDIENEVEVARSAVVLAGAAQSVGLPSSHTEVLDRLRVSVPPSSTVLVIAYSASTANAAKAGADAIAGSYLDQRAAAAARHRQLLLDALRVELRSTEKALRDVSAQAVGSVRRPSTAYARSKAEALQAQAQMLGTQTSALAAVRIQSGEVIDPAVLPTSPERSVVALSVGSGLIAGLLIGVALALVVESSGARRATGSVIRRDSQRRNQA